MGGHRAPGAGDDLVDGPVDLAAVRADDALLDAIAGGSPSAPGGVGGGYGFGDGGLTAGMADDDRIASILAAWRADIEADPMPELVSVDEALEAVTAGHDARRRLVQGHRRRMPFAIAAAAAVVALSGLTVAVHGSTPGDTLWPVSKVMFSQHAESVQRVTDVRHGIEQANDAIARRDYPAAQKALQQVDVTLPSVEPQQQAPLTAERDKVESSLTPTPPAPPSESTRPGYPGYPGFPGRPGHSPEPRHGQGPGAGADSTVVPPTTDPTVKPTEPSSAGTTSAPTRPGGGPVEGKGATRPTPVVTTTPSAPASAPSSTTH